MNGLGKFVPGSLIFVQFFFSNLSVEKYERVRGDKPINLPQLMVEQIKFYFFAYFTHIRLRLCHARQTLNHH